MVSKAKLYSQLDTLEDELQERIIPHLQQAEDGKNDLVFCVSDFNPFPKLRLNTDAETESLIQLGRQILSLREKLDESSENTIAERICWYCRAWSDARDAHGKAAQDLAREFLKEIDDRK